LGRRRESRLALVAEDVAALARKAVIKDEGGRMKGEAYGGCKRAVTRINSSKKIRRSTAEPTG
jgi:hypothetical protein